MNSLQPMLWFIAVSVLAIVGYNIVVLERTPLEISYSTLLERINDRQIAGLHLKGQQVIGQDLDGHTFSSYAPDLASLLPHLDSTAIEITAESDQDSPLVSLLRSLLPMLLLLGGWYLYNHGRTSASGGFRSSPFSPKTSTGVSFNDIAGMSEAQGELREVVDFLRFPEQFNRLGGRIPKGVLLQGPPGTGKTLLAKAVAGEAGVPFFSLSGSDFVEMFVGVGASRVRDLFTAAKRYSPCIVFIDEIDAIGGRRANFSGGSGSDEREQTLNALLVEMDGFASTQTVIIVAATNRADILDPALLRPGRFDRQIVVPIPDLRDRVKILAIYLNRVKAQPTLNLEELARSIPGFSGADIANLINEAALTAARRGKALIDGEDIELAKDKIVLGLERRSLVLSEETRRITAYHEAGHAVTARQLSETDPLHKITIIPRGRALGLTQQIALDDRMTYSKKYLENRICILLGGRVAEELIFAQCSTGAGNDIQAATELAGRLVCEWGMSEQLGPIAYGQEVPVPAASPPRGHSEETAQVIDQEIRRLIQHCHTRTRKLLKLNDRFLHKLAEALLVNETLDAEEIDIVHHCTLQEEKAVQTLTRRPGSSSIPGH